VFATVSMAASSIVLTKSASGLVPMVQLTTIPSKQSMIGENYLLVVQVFVRTPTGSLLDGNQHSVVTHTQNNVRTHL